MTRAKQRARIDAAVIPAVHVAAREALLRQARKDVSTLAWRSVQRITPEVAAQEPQSIAEMIAHLQAMLIATSQNTASRAIQHQKNSGCPGSVAAELLPLRANSHFGGGRSPRSPIALSDCSASVPRAGSMPIGKLHHRASGTQ